MYRRMLLVLLAVSTALGVLVNTGHATPSSLRDTLAARFGLSRIEVQNPSGEGHVIRQGTVLQLQADGIPANKLRFTQINTKSPRFHSPDYARVEMGRDGRLAAKPGELSLPKGTRMVVLDLKVGADRMRLLTHTLEPVRLPGVRLRFRPRDTRPGRRGRGRQPDRPVACQHLGELRRRNPT